MGLNTITHHTPRSVAQTVQSGDFYWLSGKTPPMSSEAMGSLLVMGAALLDQLNR